ncbi:alpha/beta hydrolase [Novosphingobium sp. AP12]|uniref:alpha/beta hydrolase n=1 Tax=Novosphingobium sp. AP12 TaxID=1144305 RepID=UPI000271F607|nr:alpha/beta hydrolase [Novosphingobium sp. AP12]EJL31161.1 esterase/lipase [Novosphingobium sp. AP12]
MNEAVFPDDDVDPEIRDWLGRMFASSAALGSRPGLTPVERRAIAEAQRAPLQQGGPAMAASETLTVGVSGIRIRIHRPTTGADLPVLVYLHGGGWTLFSIDSHDRLMREYAERAGVAVLGIDYPLAPESRFPAAPRSIADVLGWLQAHGSEHGLDASRFAIGGDSAGANLSVSAALRLRAEGGPMPRGLLLNYGAFDGTWAPSYERYGDGDRYMLTGPEMDEFWASYLGDDWATSPPDPLARPLHADLSCLPPTWLCTARCDILLDENVAMAERLVDAGVDTQMHIYDGATHSFLEAMSVSRIADRALTEASEWLAQRLA